MPNPLPNPKLSIIIPVYNEEKTLVEIIERIIAQPWDKELIAIDDGSTDQSLAILNDLAQKHDNFYVQSTLPQSDYNYSWISSSLGSNYSVRSGTQKVFGYWPKNGILKSSTGFDSAITFPTASEIQGR